MNNASEHDDPIARHWNASSYPLRRRDIEMLGLAIFIICCTFLLTVEEPRVRLRIWPCLLLPESCSTRIYFDMDCPGCGLTRSFIYLGQGQLLHSLHANRVGWILAACVILQLPFRIISLRRRGEFLSHFVRRCLGWAIFLILMLNWLGNLLV